MLVGNFTRQSFKHKIIGWMKKKRILVLVHVILPILSNILLIDRGGWTGPNEILAHAQCYTGLEYAKYMMLNIDKIEYFIAILCKHTVINTE